MIFNLIFSLLFVFNAHAFNNDFTIINDRAPYEFVTMFDSLKLEVKNAGEQIKMVGICKDLDNNLGFLAKEHIYLLMKNEVIKNVLEHQFSKTRQIDINIQLIDRLEKELKTKERYLNKFSQWIFKSIIAELKVRKNHGIITAQSFNPTTFEGPKAEEAKRFKRYLTYLSGWIDQMENLSASEFNGLTKSISWLTLERLNSRSLLFKKMSQSAQGDTKVTVFNIPLKLLESKPNEIKKLKDDTKDLDLKDQSNAIKIETESKMDKVSPDDMSPLSDDLTDALIEKKAQ